MRFKIRVVKINMQYFWLGHRVARYTEKGFRTSSYLHLQLSLTHKGRQSLLLGKFNVYIPDYMGS